MRGVKGTQNHRWKGGRYLREGYVMLLRPQHPRADGKGYIPEHQIVWEETHGVPLEPGQVVHHINGERADNRPENLVMLTHRQHGKRHGFSRRPTHDEASRAGKKGAEARWHPH